MALTAEDAAMEADLLRLGQEADLSVNDEEPESSPEPAKTEELDKSEEEKPPAEDEKTSESESAEAESDKTEEKQLSRYEKEKKRQADAWKKIEDEKKAAREEREAAQREREEFAKQRQTEFRDGDYTARDFETAAAQAREEGDEELAKKFEARAIGLRQQEHRHHWTGAFTETGKELGVYEELKDPETPTGKVFKGILNAHPELLQFPNGARIGLRLYAAERNAKRDADSASALKIEVERLNKENKTLRQATTIPRTGPVKQNGAPKGEKDLTEADIVKMAEEYDSQLG